MKAETRAEEAPEKKKEKPKSLRTTAPSHAKFRSTGRAVGWSWDSLGADAYLGSFGGIADFLIRAHIQKKEDQWVKLGLDEDLGLGQGERVKNGSEFNPNIMFLPSP